MTKKEHDKFTKLFFEQQMKKEKEKNWNDRFILEKIPQYDAFKDKNYISLSLMKAKAKYDENNNEKIKNKDIYMKKPMFSSHYCINSLSKQITEKPKLNYDEALNNNFMSNNYSNANKENSKNQKLSKKRPKSIYLNRNKYSFTSNSNNTNKNVFSNFINNKLKNQNLNELENIKNKNDYIYLNSRTTKAKDIQNIKFREKSFQGVNKESNSFLNEDQDLLKELNSIKEIWNQICVTQEYQNSFEEMCNSLNDKEKIKNILNNEKKQITQFKNDLSKVLNVISKREKSIEEIKKLDLIFIQNKKLIQYNRALKPENKNNKKYQTDINLNCDDDDDVQNESELEEKNNEQIQEDINNCLKSLRINTVNAVYQFNKFRNIHNFIMSSNKIDINKLQNLCGYNKDYLIKVKNDLDFLPYSNLRLIYNFQINDPFMLSISREKGDEKKTGAFKEIPTSEELISTINNLMYILAQEELLFQINFNSKTNRNNNTNKAKANIKKLKSKSPKESNQLYFNNTTKPIPFNKESNNQELKEIPLTSASQLRKRFDFYEKLRQDLTDKNENNKTIEKNENKKENLEDKKNNEENANNKDNKKEGNINFNYIWYNDSFKSFNKFKTLYNEYYKKLSPITIDTFTLNKNPEELIYGINSKIIICQKENSDKIYGICGVNYNVEGIDNNKLILKINHISSLEKDEDGTDVNFYQKEKMENKIYEKFIEKIKTLPYQIIEVNINDNEKNKELLNMFINKFNFKVEEEENKKKENINNEDKGQKEDNKEENGKENNKEGNKDENKEEQKEENKVEDNINIEKNNKKERNIPEQKVLRIYNENNNDNNKEIEEIIKKIKNIIDSNEIKYNNTSILSIIGEKDNQNNNVELEKEKLNLNKYFYKFINTFNLKILINLLLKDNIYSLSDKNSSKEKNELLSQNISKYTSLFVKEQNNNLDNIINISADCILLDTKDKEKYTYITSKLNIKLFPYLTIKYNKLIYNIFKANSLKLNEKENIYIISTKDEKITFYIYQIKEENELKKELNKSNNENFNIFEYFNQFINKQNDNTDDFKSENALKKMLWLPSFVIDTILSCNKIPIFKDLSITNKNNEKFEIKEYNEILKISYGNKELNNETLIEPNSNEDIIIDKDFIFAISHKNIKNQFNNSIVFLTYVAEDSFIKC